MDIRIIYCDSWGFGTRAASYAAEIRSTLGLTVDLQSGGKRGQFDVLVGGRVVVTRKGGLIALVTRRPWPATADVVAAVREATS